MQDYVTNRDYHTWRVIQVVIQWNNWSLSEFMNSEIAPKTG